MGAFATTSHRAIQIVARGSICEERSGKYELSRGQLELQQCASNTTRTGSLNDRALARRNSIIGQPYFNQFVGDVAVKESYSCSTLFVDN